MIKRSGWRYYTYIKPNYHKINDPLSKAFEIFIKDLIFEKEDIMREINLHGSKRIIINTEGQSNNIVVDGIVFNKDKFLMNHKLKQRLIDHYNTIGVFVKGPAEIIKKTGESTKNWQIELSLVFYKT